MLTVLAIVGALLVVGIVVLAAIAPKLKAKGLAAAEATRDALGDEAPITIDSSANCYGVQAGEKRTRLFGEGTLALSASRVVFTAALAGETLVIPRDTITEVEVERQHVVKSRQNAVLVVHYDDPDDGEATAKWQVSDLDLWCAQFGIDPDPAQSADGDSAAADEG